MPETRKQLRDAFLLFSLLPSIHYSSYWFIHPPSSLNPSTTESTSFLSHPCMTRHAGDNQHYKCINCAEQGQRLSHHTGHISLSLSNLYTVSLSHPSTPPPLSVCVITSLCAHRVPPVLTINAHTHKRSYTNYMHTCSLADCLSFSHFLSLSHTAVSSALAVINH